jgi:hypothetical protein
MASAYVIWREVRLTLAVTYVLPEDTLPAVVAKLLGTLQQLGLRATVAQILLVEALRRVICHGLSRLTCNLWKI